MAFPVTIPESNKPVNRIYSIKAHLKPLQELHNAITSTWARIVKRRIHARRIEGYFKSEGRPYFGISVANVGASVGVLSKVLGECMCSVEISHRFTHRLQSMFINKVRARALLTQMLSTEFKGLSSVLLRGMRSSDRSIRTGLWESNALGSPGTSAHSFSNGV